MKQKTLIYLLVLVGLGLLAFRIPNVIAGSATLYDYVGIALAFAHFSMAGHYYKKQA